MKVENEKQMYETGKAIGKFHKQLSDFNVDSLFEVIKDFHNTPKRYIDFPNAINGDTYFKVSKERPNHNLERTRNQLKLASEMEIKLNV